MCVCASNTTNKRNVCVCVSNTTNKKECIPVCYLFAVN